MKAPRHHRLTIDEAVKNPSFQCKHDGCLHNHSATSGVTEVQEPAAAAVSEVWPPQEEPLLSAPFLLPCFLSFFLCYFFF